MTRCQFVLWRLITIILLIGKGNISYCRIVSSTAGLDVVLHKFIDWEWVNEVLDAEVRQNMTSLKLCVFNNFK